MPNRLVNLHCDEVSGVPKSANRRRFLLRKGDPSGPVDEILVYEAAEDGDPDGVRELAALAAAGDAEALDKLQELAASGDETAARLLTELAATEEEAPMDKVRKDDRAALVARVERERRVEVERARKSVLTKAATPNPADAAYGCIRSVAKGGSAAHVLKAELELLKLEEHQRDLFASPVQVSARVTKSAAGACIANLARDPRANLLDLRGLLDALHDEGSDDVLIRAAYELRGS